MQIIQNPLDISPYNRPGIKLGKVTAVACHYVGNPGSTAINNRNYFNNLAVTHGAKASSHYIIGLDGEIIQCIPEDEISYCTNQANSYTISIEACHPDATGRFNDAAYRSYVELCADLCKRHGLDPVNGGLIRHYDVTGKNCPKWFVDHPDAWEQFKRDVKAQMEGKAAGEEAAPVPVPVPIPAEPDPGPVPAPQPDATEHTADRPQLAKGSKGEAVRELQSALNSRGAGLAVDGDFGPKTDAAVRAFQRANSLAVDGIVGPETWGALDAGSAPAAPIKPVNPYPAPTGNLRKGSRGDGVKWAQWALNQSGAGLAADGIFGDKTDAAVRAFQKNHGLAVDGIVGSKTRAALERS